MGIEFTAHNIQLDDGTLTRPDKSKSIEASRRFLSAKRLLDTVYPGEKGHLRLADLGCLEGGHSVGFARMGFQVLGVEIRESNFAACQFVKSKTDLPGLDFVNDDVWNIAEYGEFDVVFCCGLLYHLDRPKQFLELISSVTTKLVILQTHFAPPGDGPKSWWSNVWSRIRKTAASNLSPITEHEGLRGRWYTEFGSDTEFAARESEKWSSWDNRRSFWIQREWLLQAIHDVGFGIVMEQFDGLRPNIAESMLRGHYRTDHRSTFIGVKC